MRVWVKPGFGEGRYDVMLDDEKVGEVFKKVVHYNLRRPVTTIEWVLLIPDHPKSYFNTRREAMKFAETLLVPKEEGTDG